MLLVPWLLASVLSGYSVFRWRWRWVTVELIMLVWSVAVLAFTFSRSGLANLFILAFLGFLFLRPHAHRRSKKRGSPVRSWAIRLAQAAIALVVLAGMIYFAGTKKEFFARIWDY
ncbi:MAG: hypothetical protein ACWGO1_14035, partial [Anaerolineales bacterium]